MTTLRRATVPGANARRGHRLHGGAGGAVPDLGTKSRDELLAREFLMKDAHKM